MADWFKTIRDWWVGSIMDRFYSLSPDTKRWIDGIGVFVVVGIYMALFGAIAWLAEAQGWLN